jgi:hypothetical protein
VTKQLAAILASALLLAGCGKAPANLAAPHALSAHAIAAAAKARKLIVLRPEGFEAADYKEADPALAARMMETDHSVLIPHFGERLTQRGKLDVKREHVMGVTVDVVELTFDNGTHSPGVLPVSDSSNPTPSAQVLQVEALAGRDVTIYFHSAHPWGAENAYAVALDAIGY